MLQNIRDNAQGLVAKIIIGLIAISFAFFGVESLIGGGQNDVASVNGEDISLAQLNQAMLTERNRRIRMMGDDLQPDLLEEAALRAPAIEQLVRQTLLLQVADEAGIDVADTVLDQTILSMSQFQTNGQFSPELFQNVLRSSGLTPSGFKSMLRDDLVIGQLSSGIAASDFVTDKELEQLVEVIGQQRSFKFIMVPSAEVAETVEVTDDEVQDYYDQNQDQFKTEERVKLEYIEVKQQDFFEPVSEEAVREAFELELVDFEDSEERRASHILIEINDSRSAEEALQLATEIKQKLSQGEDFAALAAQFSDDIGSANAGGDLGFTSGETFPGPFESALFALDLDTVSDPVETDAGYHLIKATEVKLSDKPTFADRKLILEEQLKQQRSEAEFITAVEELRDLVFNSEGLSGPANELDLQVSQSDWISRSTRVDPLGDSRVIKAAFSESVLSEGNNSEVIELAEDHFIVVNVINHEMPHTKPLADVKSVIEERLTQEKTTAALTAMAENAVSELNDGVSQDQIATDFNGSWTEKKQQKLSSFSVNRELLMSIFNLSAATSLPYADTITLGNGDVAVVILEEIIPGDMKDLSEAELMTIRSEMQKGISSANIRNFVQSIRQTSDIEVL